MIELEPSCPKDVKENEYGILGLLMEDNWMLMQTETGDQ